MATYFSYRRDAIPTEGNILFWLVDLSILVSRAPWRRFVCPTDTSQFVAALLIKILYSVIYNLYFHPLRSFPGPKAAAATPIPFVWRLLNGRIVQWTDFLHDRYGQVVRMHPDELSFNGVSAWRDIYTSQPELPKPALGTLAAPTGVRPMPTTLTARDHNRQRRIVGHAFSDRALKEQEHILHKYIDMLMNRLQDLAREGATPVDIYSWYNFATFDIIGDLCFDDSFHCLENGVAHEWIMEVYNSINKAKMMTAFQHFPPLDSIIRNCLPLSVRDKVVKIFDFTRQKIDQRIQRNPDRPDFMHYILENNHKGGMTRDEIDATVTVLVLAGSGQTTTMVMTAATYFAMKTPGVMARLQKEIRDATRDDPANVTAEAVSSLPFLHAVLQESMRLHPVVPVGMPREVNRPGISICGVPVPQGCRVSIPAKTVYHSPSNFTDAESFHPERWLPDAPPRFSADNKAIFQPFMVGPRNCLGQTLAWMELKLVLAKVFCAFDMRLVDELNGEDWADQKVHFTAETKSLFVVLDSRMEDRSA